MKAASILTLSSSTILFGTVLLLCCPAFSQASLASWQTSARKPGSRPGGAEVEPVVSEADEKTTLATVDEEHTASNESNQASAHVVARKLLDPPTLSPGTYTFKSVGKTCRPFLSTNPDCSDTVLDTWFTQDGSGRQIFNVRRPTSYSSPYEYTISVSGGRAACDKNLFSMQDCGGLQYPDLFAFEDGSGRQTYLIQPIGSTADQYYIIAQPRLRQGCSAYLSLADCSSSDLLVRYAAGDLGTGLQRWIVTPIGSTTPTPTPTTPSPPPPPPPATTPSPASTGALLADGAYTFYAPFACPTKAFLRVSGDCTNVYGLRTGTQPNIFQVRRASGDQYTISASLDGCSPLAFTTTGGSYTSPGIGPNNPGPNTLWRFLPVSGASGQYYISSVGAAPGQDALGIYDCYTPSLQPFFGNSSSGFNLLRFILTPVASSVPMLQVENTYRIVMNARTGCENSLQGSFQYGQCSDQQNYTILSSLTSDGSSQPLSPDSWDVTRVGQDTYTLISGVRNRFSCPSFLTKAGLSCSPSYVDSNILSGFANTGTATTPSQQWFIRGVAGTNSTFTIQSTQASTCPSGSFLSVQPCGGSLRPDLFFYDDGSGRQRWTFYYIG